MSVRERFEWYAYLARQQWGAELQHNTVVAHFAEAAALTFCNRRMAAIQLPIELEQIILSFMRPPAEQILAYVVRTIDYIHEREEEIDYMYANDEATCSDALYPGAEADLRRIMQGYAYLNLRHDYPLNKWDMRTHVALKLMLLLQTAHEYAYVYFFDQDWAIDTQLIVQSNASSTDPHTHKIVTLALVSMADAWFCQGLRRHLQQNVCDAFAFVQQVLIRANPEEMAQIFRRMQELLHDYLPESLRQH